MQCGQMWQTQAIQNKPPPKVKTHQLTARRAPHERTNGTTGAARMHEAGSRTRVVRQQQHRRSSSAGPLVVATAHRDSFPNRKHSTILAQRNGSRYNCDLSTE